MAAGIRHHLFARHIGRILAMSASALVALAFDGGTSVVLGQTLSITPAGESFPTDPDHNGVWDLGDINYITARWLNTGSQGLDGDANSDGLVDLGDINFVTARWLAGSHLPSLAPAPEPACVHLAGVAVVILGRRPHARAR
jgi:hypothetical protein